MKVVVDTETCTACGLCEDACPKVFRLGDEYAEVIADPVPAADEEAARKTVEDCPVGAISVKE
ncbi:MAG TPA: ferredoxin [Candidatus Brocadiia bacterium]|nr:ferredoxin [Candidatus Brocadiia bacterium]